MNLVLSLKVPFSSCVGALVPTEELKGIAMYIPSLLFLDCSSIVSVFPLFPDKQLFESSLWNSYFLQTRNGGRGKDLFPGGPHSVLLHFICSLICIKEIEIVIKTFPQRKLKPQMALPGNYIKH